MYWSITHLLLWDVMAGLSLLLTALCPGSWYHRIPISFNNSFLSSILLCPWLCSCFKHSKYFYFLLPSFSFSHFSPWSPSSSFKAGASRMSGSAVHAGFIGCWTVLNPERKPDPFEASLTQPQDVFPDQATEQWETTPCFSEDSITCCRWFFFFFM